MVSKPMSIRVIGGLLAILMLGSVAISDEHEIVATKNVSPRTLFVSDTLALNRRVLALENSLENSPKLLRHENQQLQLQLKAALEREGILRKELELVGENILAPTERDLSQKLILRTDFGDVYELFVLDKSTLDFKLLSSKHLKKCGGILRRQNELNSYRGDIHAVFFGDPLIRIISSECSIDLDLPLSKATVSCDYVNFHQGGGAIYRQKKVFEARIDD